MIEYEDLQAKLKFLLKKEKFTKIRHKKINKRHELAKEVFDSKKEDIENLKSESLSLFLKQFIEKYNKKLIKKTQEQLAAKVELYLSFDLLRKVIDDLEIIQATINWTASQMKQLKNNMSSESTDFSKIISFKKVKIAQLKQELIELKQASFIGNCALKKLESALDDLNSSDLDSIWEVFTTTSLNQKKKEKIVKVMYKMIRLELQLELYSNELKDLSFDTYLSYQDFNGLNKTFDMFFIVLFSNWNTKTKIDFSNDTFMVLNRSVIDLQDKIEVNQQEILRKVDEFESLF